MTDKEKENRRRLREITERLKGEIFIELDRRIRETGENLSGQISDQIGEQVEEQIEGEVARQIRLRKFKKVNKKIKDDIRTFQENLQLYHKIPYAVMVVMGFLLFWYGAWSIIRVVPVLNNGIVALIGGILLLFITGAVYKKLIG